MKQRPTWYTNRRFGAIVLLVSAYIAGSLILTHPLVSALLMIPIFAFAGSVMYRTWRQWRDDVQEWREVKQANTRNRE